MIPLVEDYLSDSIQEKLKYLRANPGYVHKVLKTSQSRLNMLGDYLSKNAIKVIKGYPRTPSELPCICILLADEKEVQIGLGDYDEFSSDLTERTASQQCEVINRVGDGNGATHSRIVGMVPLTAVGTIVNRTTGFELTEGTYYIANPDLGIINYTSDEVQDGDIVEVFFEYTYSAEESLESMYDCNYRLEAWTVNGDFTVDLYHLTKWCLMSSRGDLIGKGLFRQSLAGTDFEPATSYFPEFVYRRALKFWCQLKASVPTEETEYITGVEVNLTSSIPVTLPGPQTPRPSPGFLSLKPINPNATMSTRKLLNYLYSIKGIKTLSAHHNWIEEPMAGMNQVRDTPGIAQYPAIYGAEIGTINGSFTPEVRAMHRQNTVNAVIQFVRSNNGLVTFTWHHSYPGLERSWENVQRYTTQAEFDELVTVGTDLHSAWLSEVDEVAYYLKQLQDANIPVLWRPYHEMNGGWFWWGNKTNYTTLWDLLYDRLTNYHSLNNLIWVWSANAPNGHGDTKPYNQAGMWVGVNKADVFSADIYGNDYQQKYHDDLATLAQGKLIAISENGRMPSPAILEAQPEWSWFMTWRSNYDDTPAAAKLATYQSSRVITANEVVQPNFTGYEGDPM